MAFTGLALQERMERLSGAKILVIGWLSPLVLNFAWFANVFFIYAVIQVLRRAAAPVKSSVFAVLFAFHTFAMSRFLLDEGGGNTPIWGYGWGAVLWFVAIFLLLSASGFRQAEFGSLKGGQGSPEVLRVTGLALCIVALGITGYFAIHDRMVANRDEMLRLSGLAFKRTAVCSAPDPVAEKPIRALTGPLELVLPKNGLHSNYPFAQVERLLGWGIPTIRIKDTDYSMHGRAMVSAPAEGPAAAILEIKEFDREISAKLIEISSGRRVFEQSWTIKNTLSWCPDYKSFPSPTDQPRLLVSQGLGLPASAEPERAQTRNAHNDNRVNATILERRGGGDTRTMRIARWNAAHPGQKPYHETFNRGCPDHIGWDGERSDPRLGTGWPFMVGGKAHYTGARDSYNATCAGDVVYLYLGMQVSDGKYLLRIEKRSLSEFGQVWSGFVLIPSTGAGRNDVLKVQDVREANDGVTIELVNEDSGEVLLARAPLLQRPPSSPHPLQSRQTEVPQGR